MKFLKYMIIVVVLIVIYFLIINANIIRKYNNISENIIINYITEVQKGNLENEDIINTESFRNMKNIGGDQISSKKLSDFFEEYDYNYYEIVDNSPNSMKIESYKSGMVVKSVKFNYSDIDKSKNNSMLFLIV